MTTKSPETLDAKIERLVREHLEMQQVAARTAVERAFAVSTPVRATARRRGTYTRRTSSRRTRGGLSANFAGGPA